MEGFNCREAERRAVNSSLDKCVVADELDYAFDATHAAIDETEDALGKLRVNDSVSVKS